MTISLYSQDIRRSNWQSIETNSGVDAGVSVYHFIIENDTITSTNRRGSKIYGQWEVGKKYTDGDDSWMYSLGTIPNSNLIHRNKDAIIFEGKNSFTGRFTRIVYILKN